MRTRHLRSLLSLFALFVSSVALGQNPQPTKPQAPDDVVRVFTELVQTDVMVFDKQGRFIDGLNRDNFEIKIDGQARPIQFFEQVKAGTSNEEAQLAAARGSNNTSGVTTRIVPLDRGRTVFFYIDDFHLDHSAFVATKKAVTNFIDHEMGQNDQVAINTASGQIGFLQQLTGDRNVLHLALDRLTLRSYSVTDLDRPSLSEYEAMLVDNNDIDFLEFMIDETLKTYPNLSREMAAGIVRNRAHAMLAQGARFNTNTLSTLERVVRTAKDLPGRKILFFFSSGFLVHNRRGDAEDRLQRIISASAKSGVVIYAIDARGLTTSGFDASSSVTMDLSGRRNRALTGERYETQDGLNALSRDTGGRPIFNTNDFKPGMKNAIKETSVYYLLAWKPDSENQKSNRFRNIQVNVVGRPDLTVRVRKGFFDVEAVPTPTAEATKPATPADDEKAIIAKLRKGIEALYPQTAVPIQLGLNYYDAVAKGPTLVTSVQIPAEFLVFEARDGKLEAMVDVTGVYFDDKGKPRADFYERLMTTAPSEEEAKKYHGDITYTHPANLPPGLYQVRVAVRDYHSGRSGSSNAWIEVPDLSKKELSMSSLLLGERTKAMIADTAADGLLGRVLISAGHRLQRDSTMRFLAFVYNASLSPVDQNPDIAVQVQVIRDDQPVLTTAVRKINTEGAIDKARLPYAAEVPLKELLPGRYMLLVTVIDRLAKQSTSRQTQFDVY